MGSNPNRSEVTFKAQLSLQSVDYVHALRADETPSPRCHPD